MNNDLHIIPIGGLGEIGLNCMAIEFEEHILLIDAGLMFPDDSMPGVDLVIPDFSWLKENASKVCALILTHGHEDHIGACGFLIRDFNIPVYGTRLTLALAAERLREAKVEDPQLIEITPRDKVDIGPFSLEFIRVNHSILDGVAVAVNTSLGTIIHTGDFKFDHGASEEGMDVFRFAEYGEKGVLLLLSDSTNADTPGYAESEITVGRSLESIFREAPGRVILACFASSLARIRQVVSAAKEAGRKVAFDGRGMVNIVKMAKALGYLEIGEEDQLPLGEALMLEDKKVVIVATGSQGEPMSALSRMAAGEHKQISIQNGDTIIISARFIPGHERDITRLIDSFYRQGAQVIDGRSKKIHASGHGHAEELKLMLNLTRPHYVVPVHGEMRQLVKHGELARSIGWTDDRVWVLENGGHLIIDQAGKARLGNSIPTGRKLVDGNNLGEPEDPVLRSRLKLADGGLAVVTAVLSKDDGVLRAPPKVALAGVHYENEIDLTIEAEAAVESVLKQWLSERSPEISTPQAEEEQVAAIIQKELRQLFRQSISRRPSIWPQIIWV